MHNQASDVAFRGHFLPKLEPHLLVRLFLIYQWVSNC